MVQCMYTVVVYNHTWTGLCMCKSVFECGHLAMSTSLVPSLLQTVISAVSW